MSNSTFHLFQLQKIDQILSSIDNQISILESKINDRTVVKNAENNNIVASKNLTAQRKESEDVEQKLLARRNKISQFESSLYAGKIQNSKELQDLQLEINSLKKSVNLFEDAQIEQWEKIESLEGLQEIAKKEYKDIQEKHMLLAETYRNEKSQLVNEKQRLLIEKSVAREQISESFLELYDKLYKNKKGVAVSVIVENCCGSCGTTLTPSECQQAKNHSNLVLCSNCGRILYAG